MREPNPEHREILETIVSNALGRPRGAGVSYETAAARVLRQQPLFRSRKHVTAQWAIAAVMTTPGKASIGKRLAVAARLAELAGIAETENKSMGGGEK